MPTPTWKIVVTNLRTGETRTYRVSSQRAAWKRKQRAEASPFGNYSARIFAPPTR